MYDISRITSPSSARPASSTAGGRRTVGAVAGCCSGRTSPSSSRSASPRAHPRPSRRLRPRPIRPRRSSRGGSRRLLRPVRQRLAIATAIGRWVPHHRRVTRPARTVRDRLPAQPTGSAADAMETAADHLRADPGSRAPPDPAGGGAARRPGTPARHRRPTCRAQQDDRGWRRPPSRGRVPRGKRWPGADPSRRCRSCSHPAGMPSGTTTSSPRRRDRHRRRATRWPRFRPPGRNTR